MKARGHTLPAGNRVTLARARTHQLEVLLSCLHHVRVLLLLAQRSMHNALQDILLQHSHVPQRAKPPQA